MPHEMCFLAHRGVWFERVKVEKYPIRLNSLLNYHISNHIWLHVRSKMISKSNMLIITAQNNPEQFHDQIVLIQPLFLNLIRKHFFPALSTPLGRFQELKNKFANILWQSKHLSGQLGQKIITFSKRSVGAPHDWQKMFTFSRGSVGAKLNFFKGFSGPQSHSRRPESIAQKAELIKGMPPPQYWGWPRILLATLYMWCEAGFGLVVKIIFIASV